MSKHLFAAVVTHHGSAANNRGETEGNITTLQKLLWNGAVHTTVSAEAIRWALRYWWQQHGLATNRTWDDTVNQHSWADRGFDAKRFIDDDVLGYMAAEGAKEETNPAEQGSRKRAKGRTTARRSRLEVTRAVSLTPWPGDITFNAAGIGATPSAAMRGANPVPYGTEVHATRYQFGLALTPESLEEPDRCLPALDALMQLGEVAGNQARFLFDFSPESVVFRWTDDFAPRILYPFEPSEGGGVAASKLVHVVESGDVGGDELVIGGALGLSPDGTRLGDNGAKVFEGVKDAADEIRRRMSVELGLPTTA